MIYWGMLEEGRGRIVLVQYKTTFYIQKNIQNANKIKNEKSALIRFIKEALEFIILTAIIVPIGLSRVVYSYLITKSEFYANYAIV